jgi:hypothetical protein
MDPDELSRLKIEHPERVKLLEPVLARMFPPNEAMEWLCLLLAVKPEESYPVLFKLFHEGYLRLYDRLFWLRSELVAELGDESIGEAQRAVIQDSLQFVRTFLYVLETARDVFLLSA